MTENTESNLWNSLFQKILLIPTATVNRDKYLAKVLEGHCPEYLMQSAIINGPRFILSEEPFEALVSTLIKKEKNKATAFSFGNVFWGGWALAVSLPADLVQYYACLVILAQKMAYLYGCKNLCDSNGKIGKDGVDFLTICIGIAIGVKDLQSSLAVTLETLGSPALTIVSKSSVATTMMGEIAGDIGLKITEESSSSALGKMIPVIGAVVSGGMTYLSISKAAERLRSAFKEIKIKK